MKILKKVLLTTIVALTIAFTSSSAKAVSEIQYFADADAIADIDIMAIAPWVVVERRIPVYVDGVLVGYIVYTAYEYVAEK